ncbi:MAG TPA: pitrilysin family protein [Thermoanaerobaculia bacterium]|nr:pitrilysin family protein [Thermoanaerobaculia bacterium]
MNNQKTRALLPMIFLLLAVAGSSGAQVVRDYRQIQAPPLRKFDIPEPKRIELSNGTVLFLQEDREVPLIRGFVTIRGGDLHEQADRVGLASIYGQAWRTGGTSKRTGDQLDDFLEARAAKVETFADDDSTGISWDSLKGDFDVVFDVVVELLRDPAFREEKIDLARNQINTSIARRNDNIGGIAVREARKLAYGADSPYARVPEYATVAAVTRDDLVAWHQRFSHPNNMIVGVVGDFDSKQMEQKLRKAFGSWKKGPELELEPAQLAIRPAKPGIYFIPKEDVTQSAIRFIHLGTRKDIEDYHALQVMNEVFGGGFAARLFSNIRSKQGLAYSVGGGVGTAYDHPGMFQISMGTKSGTTLTAIKALHGEIESLQTGPIEEPEVTRAKESILNSFVFNVDSREKVLREKMVLEFYGYPLDFLQRFQVGVEAIEPEEVQAAARKHIRPGDIAVLVVGRAEDFEGALADLGPVTQLDITIPQPEVEKRAISTDAAGQELVGLALRGLGGKERVESVQSVRRTGNATIRTPQGEMSVGIDVVEVFPDRIRQTMKTPMGEISMVATPDAGFMLTPGGTQPLPGSQKEEMVNDVAKTPLNVLQNAGSPDYSFAAAGTETIEGVEAKLLDVDAAGQQMRWSLHPESGVILRSRSTSMAMGQPAERVVDYRDFRDLGNGIIQPFAMTITTNGEPTGSVAVESITINPEIDPAVFQKPE